MAKQENTCNLHFLLSHILITISEKVLFIKAIYNSLADDKITVT